MTPAELAAELRRIVDDPGQDCYEVGMFVVNNVKTIADALETLSKIYEVSEMHMCRMILRERQHEQRFLEVDRDTLRLKNEDASPHSWEGVEVDVGVGVVYGSCDLCGTEHWDKIHKVSENSK